MHAGMVCAGIFLIIDVLLNSKKKGRLQIEQVDCIKVLTFDLHTTRERGVDKFVIDYSQCRIRGIQGLIPLILQ